jgi:hypothetical protein
MRLTNSSRRWKEKLKEKVGGCIRKKAGGGWTEKEIEILEVYLESLKISVHLTWKEGKYVRDLLYPLWGRKKQYFWEFIRNDSPNEKWMRFDLFLGCWNQQAEDDKASLKKSKKEIETMKNEIAIKKEAIKKYKEFLKERP